MYLSGAIIALIGALIFYTVGKRRFKRRGVGGLQHYKTYSGALITTAAEKVAKFLGWVLIVIGLGSILATYEIAERKKAAKGNVALSRPVEE